MPNKTSSMRLTSSNSPPPAKKILRSFAEPVTFEAIAKNLGFWGVLGEAINGDTPIGGFQHFWSMDDLADETMMDEPLRREFCRWLALANRAESRRRGKGVASIQNTNAHRGHGIFGLLFRVGPPFQRRFQAILHEPTEALKINRYIHLNPVRHCRPGRGYPYLSFESYQPFGSGG
jgi:hypothetical protein